VGFPSPDPSRKREGRKRKGRGIAPPALLHSVFWTSDVAREQSPRSSDGIGKPTRRPSWGESAPSWR